MGDPDRLTAPRIRSETRLAQGMMGCVGCTADGSCVRVDDVVSCVVAFPHAGIVARATARMADEDGSGNESENASENGDEGVSDICGGSTLLLPGSMPSRKGQSRCWSCPMCCRSVGRTLRPSRYRRRRRKAASPSTNSQSRWLSCKARLARQAIREKSNPHSRHVPRRCVKSVRAELDVDVDSYSLCLLALNFIRSKLCASWTTVACCLVSVRVRKARRQGK